MKTLKTLVQTHKMMWPKIVKNAFLIFLTIFRAILVRGPMEMLGISQNFQGSPDQNHPKNHQKNQKAILTIFGHIILWVCTRVFRVFKIFDFFDMKKFAQR